MVTINVGGVPEHFNLAWHLAIESGMFFKHGIAINWVDVPGGTGAMCKALRDGELDMAIALTEGMVKDVMQGNPSKIVQFYVNSPLRWGVFVNANSHVQHVQQMQGLKYAISRFQSGSHLMAIVNAANEGLTINQNDFVVVKDLSGAREALKNNQAQLFMWEKFTTKPLVDAGEFRMIGECKTPWPCFVIAASNQLLNKQPQVVADVLNIVNLFCLLLKNNAQATQLIAERYGIALADAKLWFAELEYANKPEMDEQLWLNIFTKLAGYNVISHIPNVEEICYLPHISNLSPIA